jgi:hypothetical protein
LGNFCVPPSFSCFPGNLGPLFRRELFSSRLSSFLPTHTTQLDGGLVLLGLFLIHPLFGRIGCSVLDDEGGKLIDVFSA